jgi:hypothetical protein
MSDRGWVRAPLAEIGSLVSPGYFEQWARDPDYGKGWRSIGRFLGVTGFGVNAYEASEGEELVVPHDEVPYGGQEELYYVSRGSARFTCNGEVIDVGEGELLYVRPEIMREARALATPTIIFMVGGTPGKAYEGSSD